MTRRSRSYAPRATTMTAAHETSGTDVERPGPSTRRAGVALPPGLRAHLGARDTAADGVAQATAPLPHLDRIQAAFGAHDVRDVRTSVGGDGGRAAAELGARAYTVGDRVAFRQAPDLALAAHEAAHVVQQRAGVHLPHGVGARGDRHERTADAVAGAVAAGGSVESLLGPVHAGAPATPALQLDEDLDADLYPFSNIEMLPTRAEYEQQGRLAPRGGFALNTLHAPLISLDDVGSGMRFDLVGADAPSSIDLGAFGHPNPVPASTAESTPSLSVAERVMRLGALEVAVQHLAELIGDKDLASMIAMTPYSLRGIAASLQGQFAPLILFDVDNGGVVPTDQIIPTEPAAQSRELVRTETVYERLFSAILELAQQVQQEERDGAAIVDASTKHVGPAYDLDSTRRSLASVRRMYAEAAMQPLQPRIVKTFNDADAHHGEVLSELVHAKLRYYQSVASDSRGGKPIAKDVNSWAWDLESELRQLEEEAPKIRAARDAGTLDAAVATAFCERAALAAASIEALGEYDLVLAAHDELADKWAAWGYEDVKRIRWRVEQMRDAARDSDLDYLNVLLDDHRKDPLVAQFYASVPGIMSFWQVLVVFAIALVASVASAGAGVLVGAAFAGAEGWLMLTVGFLARTGVEALVFTLVDRALSSLVGLGPTTPFWKDFLWNWGLFAAMRGAAKLMGPSLKTMGSLARFMVSHTVNFGILQAYGFVRGSIEAGHLLSADEVWHMTVQNLGMMVGLGLGMKGFQPFIGGLESKLALRQFRSRYGGEFGRIDAARAELVTDAEARMRDNPSATEADVVDLNERGRALEAELKALLDNVVADPLMQDGTVRAEAASLFESLGRQSVPETLRQLGLSPRADLLSGGREGQYSFAPGEAQVTRAALDAAGVEYTSTDTASGAVIEVKIPGKGWVQLIERPSLARENAPLRADELARARQEIAADTKAGGTASADAYTLAAKDVQTGASVAKVARAIAPGLVGEGLTLSGVKAEATVKDGPAAMRARGTLTVQPGVPLVDVTIPVVIEVGPVADAFRLDLSAHGERAGHAKYVLRADGKGGWELTITLDARLAGDADVAHHLRHELREAADVVRELARDPNFDKDGAARASSLDDPAKVTSHDRAGLGEVRDLLTELEPSISEGDLSRRRVADTDGGNARQRMSAARGADARVRIDRFLDSIGLADPATRAARFQTVLQVLGVDANSSLGRYLEDYGRRTDAAVERRAALDRLGAPTRALVEAAIQPYADVVPGQAIQPLADALTAGDTTKAATLVRERAAGNLTAQDLIRALEVNARTARADAAETSERGGTRTYKAKNPQGQDVRSDGLSKEQDAAFREQIDAAKKRELTAELTSTPLEGETALDVRYRRYLARLANAESLKPGEPMSRPQWDAANPQLRAVTSRGLAVEVKAIRAAGATASNNASGAYVEFKYYDRATNTVVTARADAFRGKTPVESKYVAAESAEQVVFDTAQTRAERAQGGKAGHIMVLSQDVAPGTAPTRLRPSTPLARGSHVYFYDPALDSITHRWDLKSSTWLPFTGPIP